MAKKVKTCIACGMPMIKPEDFAASDVNKTYCHYCANEDGTMKNAKQWLEDNLPWAMKEFNLTKEQARQQGIEHMKKQPAWKEYFKNN